MQLKHETRWFLEEIRGEVLLRQTSSNVIIARFSRVDEARWVCNRLNSGRELCIAVTNLMQNSEFVKGEAATLIEDVSIALTQYKRSE